MTDDVERAIGPDRRTFIKRAVIGTAFAAPVVSSFTMVGVKAVFASSPRSTTLTSNANTTTPNFPTPVGKCYTINDKGPLDVTVVDLAATLHLVVPAKALPEGTSVCIYRADLDALRSIVPPGETPVSGYAVLWDPVSVAKSPITLTVTDPAVGAGDPIYLLDKTTGTDPTAVGAASAGTWTVSFTDDPPYVVTRREDSDDDDRDRDRDREQRAPAPSAVTAEPRFTG